MRIAKLKKVSDVARAMGIKQPTVSFHMKSLEEQYGVQLFEFRAGQTLLTEAGIALLHYASTMTALSKEAERVLQEYREVGKGTLTIGASYVPGTYVLPGHISAFTEAYPGINIKLLIKPAPMIRQLLLEHQVDVGFISSQPFDDPQLHLEPIAEDQLVVVYAAGHPFAEKQSLDAAAILQQPFIFHGENSTTRQLTEQWAAYHQTSLQYQMELDSLEAIKRTLLNGRAISFMSIQAVREEVHNGLLAYASLPAPKQERYMYAAYHKERWLSKGLQQFLNQVLAGE